MTVLLRPYQMEAVDATFAAWEQSRYVLGVAATGLGKTIMFASIVAKFPGRCMILAHREELIFQAAQKVELITGETPDIEMAELRAAETSLIGKARVVVGTIQTQTSGRGRLHRFDPQEFDLLVCDEAHHSLARTWLQAIEHYTSNENLKVLGVTATPDRGDEQALGQVYGAVAWEYDLRFGIEDGWLAPVIQQLVHVEDLDLSNVRTTLGDLNGSDLARVLEYEGTLHQIASPTIELTADRRKTLIFCASVVQGDRLTEILNRHRDGCARFVHGGTPKEDRRQMLRGYAEREFQYLVNVGVATEGFDDPGIECVVMARPTKSRALYAQMVGRGTRPLPGVVDSPSMFGSPGMRRAAIATSSKPVIEVIDFVGNSGRHKLVTMADILAGRYPDEVVERAKRNLEKAGRGNPADALDQAQQELLDEAERARREEMARRAKVVATAKFRTTQLDPFDVFALMPWRERGWETGKQPTEKMLALLERAGVATKGLTFAQAKQLIAEVLARRLDGRCSYRQARLLRARGLDGNVTAAQAKEIIDAIAKREGWTERRREPKPVGAITRY